ncbi:uncharacterized protein BDW43DRAFT_267711 [Aspergillus alliaceus]|uniref:uncharacterized protein n=1 Tax=Petromyces alliaceus TaxID=209559 RepID=UPI0012A70041|nr:uncharacterized protein BDW43DRAFT_267711 [Aspergillus alliaceus]KAB8236157.1 hypothetical protein BDW43DRAFT_267711 [Aspergillus alliaceus]
MKRFFYARQLPLQTRDPGTNHKECSLISSSIASFLQPYLCYATPQVESLKAKADPPQEQVHTYWTNTHTDPILFFFSFFSPGLQDDPASTFHWPSHCQLITSCYLAVVLSLGVTKCPTVQPTDWSQCQYSLLPKDHCLNSFSSNSPCYCYYSK